MTDKSPDYVTDYLTEEILKLKDILNQYPKVVGFSIIVISEDLEGNKAYFTAVNATDLLELIASLSILSHRLKSYEVDMREDEAKNKKNDISDKVTKLFDNLKKSDKPN